MNYSESATTKQSLEETEGQRAWELSSDDSKKTSKATFLFKIEWDFIIHIRNKTFPQSIVFLKDCSGFEPLR